MTMSDAEQEKGIIPAGRNELAPIDPDMAWRQIVEQIVNTLHKDDPPEKVILATEYLIAGWPTYKIAKQLKIKTDTIRWWLVRYPAMAAAVSEGRKLMAQWRMARLEQQFLSAVERSQEILDLDFSTSDDGDTGVNAKLVATLAQHSRFIIGLFAGQKIDIHVTHEESDATLKAKRDALSYLAEKLAEQRENADAEPIEAVYRVIDPREETGPLVDEKGEPHFGAMGKLDRNDDGTLCHICGKRFERLDIHIKTKHRMNIESYELTFLLDIGSVSRVHLDE